MGAGGGGVPPPTYSAADTFSKFILKKMGIDLPPSLLLFEHNLVNISNSDMLPLSRAMTYVPEGLILIRSIVTYNK